jgi:hypothetical protein
LEDHTEKALEFYNTIRQALESDGIHRVIITLTPDGELEANVDLQTEYQYSIGDRK